MIKPRCPSGLLDLLDSVRHASYCGEQAVYATRLMDYCETHAREFVRVTLSGQNILGMQLEMAGKMPASIEEAERLWLLPIN